jgi:hypothetical protein
VLVDRTVAADGNTQHKIAVLAHYVDQHVYDLTDCFVLVLFGNGATVVPRTDKYLFATGADDPVATPR